MTLLSTWSGRSMCGRLAVATSHPQAAQVGLQVLIDGGNAVDAAVATAAALTVVEPTANGLGSDAFALVCDGAIHGYNGSGRSPGSWIRERFDGRDAMPRRGWDAVTVPGAVALWATLVEEHGTRDLGTLLEPAIRLAADGFFVAPGAARGWARAAEDLGRFDGWAATFLRDGVPGPGERRVLPDHAATLEELARTGGESLYRGALAERLVADSGGLMSPGDLGSHATERATPLSVPFGGLELVELPPNGQGLAALIAAGVLDRVGGDLHHQLEAMKVGFADAHRYVADPGFLDVDPADLLDPAWLDARAATVGDRAQLPSAGPPPSASTVYLCVGDAAGRMVSFIQSNYEGFGSGVVVPGTGIALQNRGAGFTLERGHPNEVGPGKRPFHTIIPALLREDGVVRCAFGVMGGAMQPQGHLQVLAHLARGLDPQAALDQPRWRLGPGRTVWLEPGLAGQAASLAARGHEPVVIEDGSVFFGGGQAVVRVDGGWVAGSDQRRDGQAVVA